MSKRDLYSFALLWKPKAIWIKDRLCYPWFDCDWFVEPIKNDLFLDVWLILNPSLCIYLFLDLWLIVFSWSCPWFMRNVLIDWLYWIIHCLLILFPCIYPLIYADLSWLNKQLYFLSFFMCCIFIFLSDVLCWIFPWSSFVSCLVFDWFSSFFSYDDKSIKSY